MVRRYRLEKLRQSFETFAFDLTWEEIHAMRDHPRDYWDDEKLGPA